MRLDVCKLADEPVVVVPLITPFILLLIKIQAYQDRRILRYFDIQGQSHIACCHFFNIEYRDPFLSFSGPDQAWDAKQARMGRGVVRHNQISQYTIAPTRA